jgi:hypothetical protein
MSEAPIPPPSPEDLDRILRAQDWGRVRARLFALAASITRSPSLSGAEPPVMRRPAPP